MNTDIVLQLQIVVASTRPQRKGDVVASWFEDRARGHGKFAVELVDLARLDLPMLDEPNHPRLKNYTQPHTRNWSARVDAADAFVFVMPEYNHGPAPALVNAIDYLAHEWAYKPVGFVSYGGVSGGLRAVQMTKPMLSGLKLVPLPEGVILPFFTSLLDADGRVLTPNATQETAAITMLDELARWAVALRPLRTSSAK